LSNYRKGARLERMARKYLESLGYYVIRSAGSKGACDLCAIGPNDVLLIQVKSAGQASKDAIDKLKGIPTPDYVTRQVWEWEGEWVVYWSE